MKKSLAHLPRQKQTELMLITEKICDIVPQAEKFLRKKGFKILTRNFNCRTGEIDLIMTDSDGTTVFVEVKTRADEVFADAESAITEVKK